MLERLSLKKRGFVACLADLMWYNVGLGNPTHFVGFISNEQPPRLPPQNTNKYANQSNTKTELGQQHCQTVKLDRVPYI